MTLDTSVLFESLREGGLGERARSLVTSGAAIRAPDLIEIELAGAITRALRRNELASDLAPRVLARARRLMPDLDSSVPLIERAFALSLELAHPIADCVFLAHAEASADVLVTLDDRLLRKLSTTAYAKRAMHLSDWQPA